MAKKNIVLSDEQFKDIKDTILDNVLKVLPNIINEIFPVIMEKVSDIIKSNINDYVPVSRSTGHQANVTEVKDFINVNNSTWINFIKKRKDEYYKYTRCDQLINLYNDCLAEELMYIPRKFRQDSTYVMNDQEKQLYEKLSLEKLKTEMEVLATRREHFRLKLDNIDNEFKAWLQTKETSEDLENNVSLEWEKDVENTNKRIEKVWEKNIDGKKNAFKKDKEALKKEINSLSSQESQQRRPPNQNRKQEYRGNNYHRSNGNNRYNNNQSKNWWSHHHQPYKRNHYHQRSSTYHHTHYQDRNYRY